MTGPQIIYKIVGLFLFMSLKNFSKKRILVVDELEAFRFSTKQSLMQLGFKLVDTASTAQSVITGFQTINYDVVFCNYDLGKGKNGQQLLEELRYKKLLKFTGLFFIVSAEVERGKVMGTLDNEPDGYLVKPVTPRDLEQRLTRSLEAKEAMRLVNEAIDDGDFRSALAYCDSRLSDSLPYRATCSKSRAWLLTKLGQFKEAKSFYTDLVAENNYLWAQFGLAEVLIKLQEYEEAEKLLKQIIETDPDYIEALDLLAELYTLRNQSKDAQDVVQQAIERSPNSILRQQKFAALCVENKDTQTAIDAFQQVIKLGDQSVYASPEQYYDFANYLASQAKERDDDETAELTEEAFKLLEKANKRFSNSEQIETQSQLVGACLKVTLGDEASATKILEGVLAKKDSADESYNSATLQACAKTLESLGRKEEAEKMLEEAADLAASDSDEMTGIYHQLNQSVSTEARQQAKAFNKNGIKLYQSGDVEEAARELRMAVPLTPRHISLNLNLIQVLLKLSSINKSATDYAEIERYLHKVRHIPTQHYEYPRYQYLKEKFEQRSP